MFLVLATPEMLRTVAIMALPITLTQLLLLVLASVTIYAVSRSIYLLFYHPLANYPGPRIAAISNAFYAYIWMGGRYPFEIEKLHNQYGPVVRIAPNELSFSTTQSFNDIYGHSGKDHKAFIKGTFYEHGLPEPGIVAERNPEHHRETRRLLSHGFSAKALKEQEGLLAEYIDLFVSQLAKHGTKSTGVNMKEWFNWLSFDIIGELAFGESFGAVKAAKSHFWIDTIHDGAYLVTMFQIGRRLPLLWPFILLSIPLSFKKKFDFFLHFSKKQVQARVARQPEIGRQDFFSNLLSDKAENKSEEWLIAQANVLVIAGSDTTATALTTILYFLSKNPISLSRLQAEIRENFTAKGDMTSEALQGLPYLGAVIDEGLRIFPPTAFGLPRISPGALVDGYMVPAGTTVHTSSWTTTHERSYFTNPRSFCPERWLPPSHRFYSSTFDTDDKGAARPFSLGPRGCLGLNLALLEMRKALAMLVWCFDWELVNAHDIDWERDTRFEGFWQIPEPRVRFVSVR